MLSQAKKICTVAASRKWLIIASLVLLWANIRDKTVLNPHNLQ